MEEEMTPERTPHITLVSSVSSEREEWAGNSEREGEHTALCSVCRRRERGRERSHEKWDSPSGLSTSSRLKVWYVPILIVP